MALWGMLTVVAQVSKYQQLNSVDFRDNSGIKNRNEYGKAE
jgi:hypothetical protein